MRIPPILWEKTLLRPIEPNELVRLCAYSKQAPEWELFVRSITPVVVLTARRVSQLWGESSSAVLAEIVQEVFLRLCENERRALRDFEDRGGDSFFKFLRVVTASVATDYFRRAHAEKRGGGAVPLDAASHVVADNQAMEAVEWPALMAQLDSLLRQHAGSVSERDRQVFWLYYRQGLSADAIARIPAVQLSAKGVESALRRMGRLLRDTIAASRENSGLKPRMLPKTPALKGFSAPVTVNNVKRQ